MGLRQCRSPSGAGGRVSWESSKEEKSDEGAHKAGVAEAGRDFGGQTGGFLEVGRRRGSLPGQWGGESVRHVVSGKFLLSTAACGNDTSVRGWGGYEAVLRIIDEFYRPRCYVLGSWQYRHLIEIDGYEELLPWWNSR